MNTTFLKINNPDLEALRPVLSGWLKILHDYRDRVNSDTPWSYRERTHIGFFSAAVWKTNGAALEEWTAMKGPHDAPKKGRCDLWIRVGQGRSSDFFIEAKHGWCTVSSKEEVQRRRIEKVVDAAKGSLSATRGVRNEHLAFAFLAPVFGPLKMNPQSAVVPRLKHWRSLVEAMNFDAIAGILSAPKLSKKGWVGAGIVLAIKRYKRISHAR
jgi:hypothetical protein